MMTRMIASTNVLTTSSTDKPDEGRAVDRIGVFIAFRECLGLALHLVLHQLRRFQRVRARRKLHGNARCRMAVETADDRIAFGAEFDARHVLQQHARAIGLCLEHDLAELFGRAQPGPGGYGRGQHLVAGGGLRTDLTGRDLRVLCLDRGGHVAGHELHARKLERVEPDAHRILRSEHVDVADALDAADRILQVRDEEIGHVVVVGAIALVIDADDQQEVRTRLGDDEALLLHLLGQAGEGLLNLVLHLHLRDVGIGALGEGGRDRSRSRRTRRGCEIDKAVDACQLLLDDLRHAGFERVRRSPRIGCADIDRRRGDVRVLLNRQRHDGAEATEHDDDGDDPGENGPVDECAGNHLGVSASRRRRPPAGAWTSSRRGPGRSSRSAGWCPAPRR